MPKYVIRSSEFIRKLTNLDKSYLDRAEKLIIKIISSPEIGKPMMYDRKGTREVYLPPFRFSYAFDKSSDTLTFLEIYHKKKQ